MKITDRTIQFIDGQCVTTHTIFEDENGVSHIHEPGATRQRWHRLEDYGKNRVVHDPATFYANARRSGHVLSPHAQIAEASAKKAEALRGQSRVAPPQPKFVIDQASGKFVSPDQK